MRSSSFIYTAKFTAVSAATAMSLMAAVAMPAKADDDDKKFPTYLDEPVHPTAQNSCHPGQLWQGTGNPATTFQRKRNVQDGVELAIKAFLRQQGGDFRSTYVDKDGLVHVEVPSGSQVLPAPHSNRAKWNFTYSYDVALDPSNPTLDNYEAELWIDLDPSEKTDFLKLELVKLGPPAVFSPCTPGHSNGYGWKNKGTTVIPDDEGTNFVTQNSQNLGFYLSLIDNDPKAKGIQPYTFGPGQFDVVMSIKRKGTEKTVLHVVFDVVDAPTQTP